MEERVEGDGGGEGGVFSSVYGVVSQRRPVTPARPGLTPPHIRTVRKRQIRRWGGGGLYRKERRRLALLVFNSQGPGPPPPSFTPSS